MGDSLDSRLAYCCSVLELIDRRRAATGDDGLGSAIEHRIIDRELRELERLSAADEMARERQ